MKKPTAEVLYNNCHETPPSAPPTPPIPFTPPTLPSEDQAGVDAEQKGGQRIRTLMIRDFQNVINKGRPVGALNKKRTAAQAEFENSTRRELSRFEHEKRAT